MTKTLEIYKCNICGNVVEVEHQSYGELVCCDEPMMLLTPNTVEASQEKHLPVIGTTNIGLIVKVGSVPHPMEKAHYIEWIEAIIDNKAYRQFLSPGDTPEATFPIKGTITTVRAYCNLHGLWKS